MTYSYGDMSLSHLQTCDERLQELMHATLRVSPCDIRILEGHRSIERQKRLFEEGRTKIDGVNKISQHNHTPSRAVDIAPYPVDWNNAERFYWLAGAVFATANRLQIPIRWGGDWDGDASFADQNFDDLPHFELLGEN